MVITREGELLREDSFGLPHRKSFLHDSYSGEGCSAPEPRYHYEGAVYEYSAGGVCDLVRCNGCGKRLSQSGG